MQTGLCQQVLQALQQLLCCCAVAGRSDPASKSRQASAAALDCCKRNRHLISWCSTLLCLQELWISRLPPEMAPHHVTCVYSQMANRPQITALSKTCLREGLHHDQCGSSRFECSPWPGLHDEPTSTVFALQACKPAHQWVCCICADVAVQFGWHLHALLLLNWIPGEGHLSHYSAVTMQEYFGCVANSLGVAPEQEG